MRKGFSLIELLIVIAIISLFGFLIFDFLKKAEIKPDPYTIKSLKQAFKNTGDTELVCLNKCTQCFLITPGSGQMQEVESSFKEIQAYIVDQDEHLQKIAFGRMDDHPVCLRFTHYTNDSSTQIILRSEGKFFYFPSYFGEVSMHGSAEDAAEQWIGDTKLLGSQGGYY